MFCYKYKEKENITLSSAKCTPACNKDCGDFKKEFQ